MMKVGLFMVLTGLVSFLSIFSHVLMMLLSLEFVMLGMFFIFSLLMSLFEGEMYFKLLFLMFMVCEGALGLSLVILLNRVCGNDYLLSLSLLEC